MTEEGDGGFEVLEIPRLRDPGREEVEKMIAHSQPFIWLGLVDQWPAFERWKDPQYLIEKIGADTEVSLRKTVRKKNIAETEVIQQTQEENTEEKKQKKKKLREWLGTTEKMPFGEFIEHWLMKKASISSSACSSTSASEGTSIRGNEDEVLLYLASLPINRHFASLASDVEPQPHPALEQHKSANLWIGSSGQVTPVHHDWSAGEHGMDGLHGVILGRKKFTLFDPGLNAHRFPRRRLWGKFHQAAIDDLSHRFYDRFRHRSLHQPSPQEASAQVLSINKAKEEGRVADRFEGVYRVILEPGEMLFIPKLWWHHVETLDSSIAVNFWFQNLNSERLKLNRFWPHMEQYLLAVEKLRFLDNKRDEDDLPKELKIQEGEKREEEEKEEGDEEEEEELEAELEGEVCEKLLNVVVFFTNRQHPAQRATITKEELLEFRKDPYRLMLLPKFLRGFGSIGDNPLFRDQPGVKEFSTEMQSKVKDWIENRMRTLQTKRMRRVRILEG